MRKRHFSRGFTLVEVLVILSIIALLIALLLPAMQGARESTWRAICMSNQRQLVYGLATYSNENKTAVPIGYEGNKQFNYLLYNKWKQNNSIDGFMAYGRLYVTGIYDLKDGYFCPTSTLKDADWNPWPPGSVANENTRSDYASRPYANWGNGMFPSPMPRLADLIAENLAVLADRTSNIDMVNSMHDAGVVVTHMNAAARWIPREVFEAPLLSQVPGGFTSSNNNEQQAVWDAFDTH